MDPPPSALSADRPTAARHHIQVRLPRYAARTSRCCLRPADSLIAPSLRVAQRDHLAFLGHRRIVHPRAAAADQPPRLAIARRQTRQREQPERRDASFQIRRAAPPRWAACPPPRLPRTRAERFPRPHPALSWPCARAVAAVASSFFASLISAPASASSRAISGQRQIGEQAQEAADIGILGVAPELPVIVRRHPIAGEPHRARRRLAHLGARRGRNQRRGQAEHMFARRCAASAPCPRRCCPIGRSRRSAAPRHAGGAAPESRNFAGSCS